jgi:hypothetical protein
MNVRYYNLLNMSAVLCVILAITVHYVLHVILKDDSCGIVCLLVRFRYVGKRCLRSHQLPPLSFALSIRPSSFAVSLSSVPLFLYRVIHKSLWNFRTRLHNNQDGHSRKELSSTCKVGQKLGVSLPLLTCFPSAWPSRLPYRCRTARRDLWIAMYCFNPLTPELNPSAQRCLTRFFLLEILLLEPCISLIYAWKTNKYTNYSFRLLIVYGTSYMIRHYIAILRECS